MHREVRAQKIRIDVNARAVDQHNRVLEKDGRAQGRNHGRETTGIAQGAVGRALQQKAEQRHQQAHHDEDRQHGQGQRQHAGEITAHQKGQAQIGADGEQIAVREVDELEHAVDHGVAQGHQRVNAAHGKAVQKLLKKLFHAIQYSVKSRPGLRKKSKIAAECGPFARRQGKQAARRGSVR